MKIEVSNDQCLIRGDGNLREEFSEFVEEDLLRILRGRWRAVDDEEADLLIVHSQLELHALK